MNLVLTVLEIVAPVFLLALIGYVWVKLGYEYRIQFVTQLAMTLSVPALVFTALIKADIDADSLRALSLASVAAYALLSVAMWIFVRLWRLDRRTFLAPLIFGNTGNLGLPLALFAFGETGLAYAVIIFAIMAIYSFTFGVWLVSGGGSLSKPLKEPLVWASLFGGLFLVMGWGLPPFLMNTLSLVGQMAIPLMLITLGVALARITPNRLGRAAWMSIVKLVISILCAAFAGRAMGLNDVALAVLILQVSTPVAVTSYLLAEKYGADSDQVAALVVVSTLISVLALPLVIGALL